MSMPLPLLRILNPLSADLHELHEHHFEQDRDFGRSRRAAKHRSAPQQASLGKQLHQAPSPLNPAHVRTADLFNGDDSAYDGYESRANITSLVAREVNARLRAIGDALADTLAQEEAHEAELARRLDDAVRRVDTLEASMLFKGGTFRDGGDEDSERDLTVPSAVHALHTRLNAIEAHVAVHSARIDALEARLGVASLQTTPSPATSSIAGISATLPSKSSSSFRLSSIPTSIPNLGISSSLAKLGHRLSLSRSSSRQSDTYVYAPAAAVTAITADDQRDAEGEPVSEDASSTSSSHFSVGTTRTRTAEREEEEVRVGNS
ncbi:hypothetical protein HDU83_005392 [Entophlyctis luteolus]|nr:hypothetical protein HDU83_005392 [Entophlyctis luteolus]KAJ3380274.1 hypothetical protein HDU84_006041 [Entophlyctis sp. JEL0112]